MGIKLDPKDDGITHINVYSRGKTKVGKLLSNFAPTPFTCEDGKFGSIEAYWYWLSIDPSNPKREEIRHLYGYLAKKMGRELRGDTWSGTKDFKKKILFAIRQKLIEHPEILKLLKESTLPLRHYYNMHGRIHEDKASQWMLNYMEKVRKHLQEDKNGS